MSFNNFWNGILRAFDQMFLGKEQMARIQERERESQEAQAALDLYTLSKQEVTDLGQYGQQLQDLNKRRHDIAASLAIFDGDDSSLDVNEIREHMAILYDDAKREATKLAKVSAQLDVGERPDIKLKEQIHELAQRVEKTTDPAIRENLIETANSKTKALLELGKIAIYTTRVQTKVTRLDAFLGELQLGAMRAGLEEDANYHRTELANSMKAIRSSFEAVDEFRTETKLLTESVEKQDEEVPYYIRYKEVWAGKEAAKAPDPPQRAADHLKDIEKMNEMKAAADQLSSTDQDRDRRNDSTSPQTDGSTNTKSEARWKQEDSQVTVECPICKAQITFEAQPNAVKVLCVCHNLLEISYEGYRMHVTPMACPKCENPGPFGEVAITYHDGLLRFHCGSCNRYFVENEVTVASPLSDWTLHTNVRVNRHCVGSAGRSHETTMSNLIVAANEEYTIRKENEG